MLLELIAMGAAAISAGAAVLAWRAAAREHRRAERQWNFETYFNAQRDLGNPAYLRINGITPEELAAHETTPAEFTEYMVATNIIWSYRLTSDRWRSLEKKNFASYDEGLEYVVRKKLTLPSGTSSHRLVRSQGYERAWNLVKRFWSRTPSAYTAMVIEASMSACAPCLVRREWRPMVFIRVRWGMLIGATE